MTRDPAAELAAALVAIARTARREPSEVGGPAAGVTAAVAEAIAQAADDASQAVMLVDLVRGTRIATDVLRELELEAARQARAREIPLRALASATGMAERSAASRYKSPGLELARTDDGPALIADETTLLPVIDLLRHAGLTTTPLVVAGAGRSTELQAVGLDVDDLDQVLQLLAEARYTLDRGLYDPEHQPTRSTTR
jgi:hypothetical protein